MEKDSAPTAEEGHEKKQKSDSVPAEELGGAAAKREQRGAEERERPLAEPLAPQTQAHE